MQILIVSNRADFFREVFLVCRNLLPEPSIRHLSCEAWESADLSKVPAGSWVVRDGDSTQQLSSSGRVCEKPFALARWVCHNIAEKLAIWETLSPSGLILRVQEFAIMTSSAPSIQEDVIVRSPHLRVTELKCATRSSLIPQLRNRLLQGISEFSLGGTTVENHFCMALEEALANAFYHGNLELSSDLREDGSCQFSEIAAEREKLMPYKRRLIRVTETASPFGLWVKVSDEGKGFDVAAALERANNPELLLASGRGLLMMKGFTDELFFNSAGNEVTLVLYRRGPDRELPVRVRRAEEEAIDSEAAMLLSE
ncbi:MAG: ATP-binding protein [Planctomyces sp.]|nr:ATP-binding protein [Planctomyces sp.]